MGLTEAAHPAAPEWRGRVLFQTMGRTPSQPSHRGHPPQLLLEHLKLLRRDARGFGDQRPLCPTANRPSMVSTLPLISPSALPLISPSRPTFQLEFLCVSHDATPNIHCVLPHRGSEFLHYPSFLCRCQVDDRDRHIVHATGLRLLAQQPCSLQPAPRALVHETQPSAAIAPLLPSSHLELPPALPRTGQSGGGQNAEENHVPAHPPERDRQTQSSNANCSCLGRILQARSGATQTAQDCSLNDSSQIRHMYLSNRKRIQGSGFDWCSKSR